MRTNRVVLLSVCVGVVLIASEASAQPWAPDGPEEEPGIRLHIGASAAMNQGLFPSVAPGVLGSIGGSLTTSLDSGTPLAFLYRFEFQWFPEQSSDAGRYQAHGGTTRLCMVPGWGGVNIGGCLGLSFLGLPGSDQSVYDVTVGGLTGLYVAWPFAKDRFAIQATASATFFTPSEYFDIDPVGFQGTLGMEWRFMLFQGEVF